MKRRHLAALVLVVALGLLLGSGFAWIIGSLKDANRDVAALRAQILAMGEQPIIGPSGEPGKPGNDGGSGPAGRDGRDGRDAVAVDGIDGRDGLTPPCYFTPTQCVGAPGQDGRDGQDGADSTVPGPKGDPGADSTVPGPQGEPGPPPASFSFTWANTNYVCTDPDGDGNYTCEDDKPVGA